MDSIVSVSWYGETCGILDTWKDLKPYEKVFCPIVLFFKTLYTPIAIIVSWALAIPTLASALLCMCGSKIPVLRNILAVPLTIFLCTSRILATEGLLSAFYPFECAMLFDDECREEDLPTESIQTAFKVLDPTNAIIHILHKHVKNWLPKFCEAPIYELKFCGVIRTSS
jgi:hypothetical protein